jgi:UDP-N-acetylmuramyl pentapeptide phosphotransferase/UDP-N-acetylglucosamine-1-phosphate transferase
MERYGFCFACLMMIAAGVWMAVRPRQAALQSRDEKEDARPATSDEVWQMRIGGGVLIVAGFCFLCALLMKLPGTDFLTP